MTKYLFQAPIVGEVNRETGVITGVSVITAGVVRGHGVMADNQTLIDVMNRIIEFGPRGVKVKADHWTGFDKIVGVIQNPRVEGDQLRADLHLLTRHPMYEQIVELADRMPGSFGLSIAFSGSIEEKEKLPYVRVTELYSVDLVDEPAANPTGLFAVTVDPKNGENMTMTEIKTAVLEALGVKQAVDETKAALDARTTERDALQAKLDESIGRITALTTERDKLNSEFTAAKEAIERMTNELAAAKAAVTEFDAKVKHAASLQALQITQGQGQPAVPQVPTSDQTAGKGDIKALKGLDKVRAAFEEQLKGKA
jgi:hypothetical protein